MVAALARHPQRYKADQYIARSCPVSDTNFRSFDFTAMSGEECYRLMASSIIPRPVAWVVTVSKEGQRNAAPFSFFNMFGQNPPIVALGVMRRLSRLKDTARNIRDTGEFVVNLVPAGLAEAMNLTSIDAPADVDELDLADMETVSSTMVVPPRISRSPVAYECRLQQMIETGPAQDLVIGQVIAAHFHPDILGDGDRPHVDASALDLVGRMHGPSAYTYTRDLFDLRRPVWKQD